MAVPTTPRLTFHEMTPADLDDMALLLGDERTTRYYTRRFTRCDANEWIAWNQRNYREHGFGLWLLRLRSTGEFVGDCGLTIQEVDGVHELEVGYHVHPSLWGLGYATEAAAASRDFARRLGTHDRLIAIINPMNVPSQRVAVKIGLQLQKRTAIHGSPSEIYAADV